MRIEKELEERSVEAERKAIVCAAGLTYRPVFDAILYRHAMPGIARLNEACPKETTVYRLPLPDKHPQVTAFYDENHADGLPVRVICCYDPDVKNWVVMVDACWEPVAAEPEIISHNGQDVMVFR